MIRTVRHKPDCGQLRIRLGDDVGMYASAAVTPIARAQRPREAALGWHTLVVAQLEITHHCPRRLALGDGRVAFRALLLPGLTARKVELQSGDYVLAVSKAWPADRETNDIPITPAPPAARKR